MHLGIGSYTYTWAVGVPGHVPPRAMGAMQLLERAHSLGVRVVQLCDNLPLAQLSAAELDRLAGAARDLSMTIEVGTRGLSERNLLKHLGLAHRFGSEFLRVVVDSSGDEPTPADTVKRVRPLLPRFAAAGVKFAIENHDRFSARNLARIVEELGPEEAGVCLDTVNSFGALEGPEYVVKVLAPYALNLHVKDFTINRVGSQMGFTIAGCAAGTGRLDIPWLLQELRAAGRDCNAIIELWTPMGSTLQETIARESDWAEQSVRYLRQFISD